MKPVISPKTVQPKLFFLLKVSRYYTQWTSGLWSVTFDSIVKIINFNTLDYYYSTHYSFRLIQCTFSSMLGPTLIRTLSNSFMLTNWNFFTSGFTPNPERSWCLVTHFTVRRGGARYVDLSRCLVLYDILK